IQAPPDQHFQHRRSGTRFHAWGASRCFATQTMVARNPPGVAYRGTFGRLSQRIRLSFQPPPLPPPRVALSPTPATCCRYSTHSVQAVAFSWSDVKPQPVVVTVLRQLPRLILNGAQKAQSGEIAVSTHVRHTRIFCSS